MQGKRQLKRMTPKMLANFSGTISKTAKVHFVASEANITNRAQRRAYEKNIRRGIGA